MPNIFRLDENTPEPYISNSRDFQLLVRLLTVGINSSKLDSDGIRYLNSPRNVNNRMLPLMQTKVGFFTHKTFLDDYIRNVCEDFYSLTRNKGSRTALIQAVRLFFQCVHMDTNAYISIINEDFDGVPVYEVQIGINSSPTDVSLLDELLKYILPTGYLIRIYFYEDIRYITEIYNNDQYDVEFISAKGYAGGQILTADIIKNKIMHNEEGNPRYLNNMQRNTLKLLASSIDTMEVKEIDLTKEQRKTYMDADPMAEEDDVRISLQGNLIENTEGDTMPYQEATQMGYGFKKIIEHDDGTSSDDED